MLVQRPNAPRVSGAGPRASLSCAGKHARPRIHCSRLLGARGPAPTPNQKSAPQVVAPPGRGAGAHRRDAHPSLAFVGGSHEPPRRTKVRRSTPTPLTRRLLLWSARASAEGLAHRERIARRVRRTEARSGGA
jgi:hypothetical protein